MGLPSTRDYLVWAHLYMYTGTFHKYSRVVGLPWKWMTLTTPFRSVSLFMTPISFCLHLMKKMVLEFSLHVHVPSA